MSLIKQAGKKNAFHGKLSKGCELCITGEKSVLFITGICPRSCFYCPISDEKYQHDVTYINEWKTGDMDDLITEVTLCQSKGVGITGGDPLARIDRTCTYIKTLKKRFGKQFHIHLYTSLNLFTKTNLKKLYKAGLDEIRCHPDLDDKKLWSNIKNATMFVWTFGMEIPAIPGKEQETRELIAYAKDYVQYINLNELEYSDTNAMHLKAKKYHTKNSLSYAIGGSEEMAKKLLKEFKNQRIHYCSAQFKDKIQLRRRILKRAESIKKEYEQLTEDGTITKGVIYLKDLVPGIGYKELLKKQNKKQRVNELELYKTKLLSLFTNLDIDETKFRLCCSVKELKKNKAKAKKLGLVPAIVEEYPTHDAIEVEIDLL